MDDEYLKIKDELNSIENEIDEIVKTRNNNNNCIDDYLFQLDGMMKQFGNSGIKGENKYLENAYDDLSDKKKTILRLQNILDEEYENDIKKKKLNERELQEEIQKIRSEGY
ncbi:MAG: hypothetical protein PHH04_06510 [Thomasclavelia sp.]|nr:hypothetical protein [Thomasclavelia sp.]